jgi:nitrate/TMAO reductase-like tetraheme cytochrome c subunit
MAEEEQEVPSSRAPEQTPTPPVPERAGDVPPSTPIVTAVQASAPPPKRRRSKVRWLAALLGLAVIALFFFMATVTVLDYTESTAFCTTCHVMKPEQVAHDNSPHARTDCGTCHIGPGAVAAIQGKLQGARYLYVLPLGLYKKPIPSPIEGMRPVEVVCEQCHWPQKNYDQRLVVKSDYAKDQVNSLTRTQLLLRTGGGTQAAGLGRGIHWHIDNPVYYIATDDKRQTIPWVQAEFQGVTTTYVSADSNLTPDFVAKAEKRKMDCIDCHNRATHDFENPDDALNAAMAAGTIASDLPFIKREGSAVLNKVFGTEEEAAKAIAAVADFYRSNYPDVYAKREADVKNAVAGLQAIFDRTAFPFMNVTWQSHPNNVGHLEFAGCFRCHDGKHLSSDNQSIRLECNLCHNIPQVAGPGKQLPALSLSAPKEPQSHLSTTWLAEHRYKFEASCATCHTVDNPGGSDNTSFCSNSACHGTQWKFVGLDAPKLRELVAPPKAPSAASGPPIIPHPIAAGTNCLLCHAADKVRPFPSNHATFKIDMCTQCHKAPDASGAAVTPAPTVKPVTTPAPTAAAKPTTAPAAGNPPSIPHTLVGRDNCLICHDIGQLKPYPADHKGRTIEFCQACHKPRT